MVLPLLVSVEDFRLWPGVTVPADRVESAEVVLQQASALVRSETGKTWEGLVPDEVRGVVLQVAARVWTNPQGAIQRTTGPYVIRFSEAVADGLYLTDTERGTLARHRVRSSGLTVVSTTRGDLDVSDTVWVPTSPLPGPLLPFLTTDDLKG